MPPPTRQLHATAREFLASSTTRAPFPVLAACPRAHIPPPRILLLGENNCTPQYYAAPRPKARPRAPQPGAAPCVHSTPRTPPLPPSRQVCILRSAAKATHVHPAATPHTTLCDASR